MKPRFALAAVFLVSLAVSALADGRDPLPFRAAAKMLDRVEMLSPAQVKLTGYLGRRVSVNEANRLLEVDLEPLLAGYRHKPGVHPWIGEHIGKWMHAATLAWSNTGDEKLHVKLVKAAKDLIATQEADGYLGTYLPEKRFGLFDGADWDVWSHKYCLLGLLTYYQYTGDKAALTASRKATDLLIRTFGPSKKSILSAGTQVGMASTSVLEPIVLLYRDTGDAKYLDFAKYIVSSWDEPNGPKVLTTLTTLKSVGKTANGKAYEMLSNLLGLCELARATGDQKYLTAAKNGWDDVVANQLYLTGTASYFEVFHGDHDLPNATNFNIGETCVTVTWIQLSSQLMRLTGEARYGNEIEKSYYNHLSAAQRPDGKEWCYYTSLEGRKPYGPGISCCVSSGPRGMAMAPQMVYFVDHHSNSADMLDISMFESSVASVKLGGQSVQVVQKSEFPVAGRSKITFIMSKPGRFGLRMRTPEWARHLTVAAGGQLGVSKDGWTIVPPREWKSGEAISVNFEIGMDVVKGDHSNAGKVAIQWGPIVMAYDTLKNPKLPPSSSIVFTDAANQLSSGNYNELHVPVVVRGSQASATFIPFSEAGSNGESYRIWIGAPGTTPGPVSLAYDGEESRSVNGNVGGSIIDGDPSSFAVTFDGRKHDDEWFSVALATPEIVQRLSYSHGSSFHDGGWFDASAGRPRLQVKLEGKSEWQTVGELSSYPATTATDSKGLRPGQTFELKLEKPMRISAIRVIGKGAHGDNPAQCFASCAELQAFK